MADQGICDRVAALVSGGIESALLLHDLSRQYRRVQPIYVRFGLRWERAELASLRRLICHWDAANLDPLVILDQPVADIYGDHWSLGFDTVPGVDSAEEAVELRGRNLLLLAKASIFCKQHGIETLALGTLATNPFPDGSAEFFRAMEAAVNFGPGKKISLIRPFERLTKAEVICRGVGLPWELTFSCLDPIEERPCGACNKCAERDRALADSKISRTMTGRVRLDVS